MKKIGILLWVLLVCVGCGRAEKSTVVKQEKIKIGLSLPNMQEERWQKDRDEIVEFCEENGVEVLVQSANGDGLLQISQCENLISQGISALIVIALDGKTSAPIVKTAHESDVEVICLDRLIEDSDVDYYVAYDAFQIGVIQAEYLMKAMSEGNIVLVGGSPVDPNAPLIRQGQMSVLQPYIDSGAVQVVGDTWAMHWNPDEAAAYIEAFLQSEKNDIQAIVSSNDGCAGAIIPVLAEYGMAGSVYVTGLDCDLAACQRIVEGTQLMTVFRDFSTQNLRAAKIAIALAKDQKVEYDDMEEIENGRYKVPTLKIRDEKLMYGVDAENMMKVVDAGWLEYDDIYKNIPEKMGDERQG